MSSSSAPASRIGTGLAMLAALLFRPSAWHRSLRAIDSTLPDAWCLLELTPTQRSNSRLRRFILSVKAASLLLVVTGATAVLALLGTSVENLVFGVGLGAFVCLAGGLVGELLVGFAPGSVGGLVGGLLGGIAYGVAGAESLNGVFAVGHGGIVALGGSALVLGMAGSTIMVMSPPLGTVRAGQIVGIVVLAAVTTAAVYGLTFVGAFLASDGQVGTLGFGLALHTSMSLMVAVVSGWRAKRWQTGLICGLAFLIVNAAAVWLAIHVTRVLEPGPWHRLIHGMAAGLADGTLICAAFGLPYVVANDAGGPRAGAVAGTMGSAVAYLIYVYLSATAQLPFSAGLVCLCGVTGLTASFWRPLFFYPLSAAWNIAVFQADSRGLFRSGPALTLNAAFWDELQFLPQARLDAHLVLLLERAPESSAPAVEYLLRSSQRWAVPLAYVEIDARMLEHARDIRGVVAVGRELENGRDPTSTSPAVRDFLAVSTEAGKALARTNIHRRRNDLFQVRRDVEALAHNLARGNRATGRRFSSIAEQWRAIVDAETKRVALEADAASSIDNPYIVAVPISAEEKLFVGRTDISSELERLLSARHIAPLLLYGQRRMGKTSLLYNLARLLPRTFVPLFVSAQGPLGSAEDYPSFLSTLARRIRSDALQLRDIDLPPLSYEALASNPAETFDAWLEAVELALGDRRALLCIDEFEALTGAFTRGRLAAEDVLGLLRHIMQHHRRFGVLVAASQSLDELRPWASYLVNVRVIHLSYLTHGEASQLIERPVDGFALRYEPAALARVHELSRGHPWLVQALCHEIVSLKNEQALTHRFLCAVADVDAAASAVFERSSMLFSDIEDHQVTPQGRQVLRALARQGPGAVAHRSWMGHLLQDGEEVQATIDVLMRRELIEPTEQGYRFQVEMIRQWFARE